MSQVFFDMSVAFNDLTEPFTIQKISYTNDGFGKTQKVIGDPISVVGFVRYNDKPLKQLAEGYRQWKIARLHTQNPIPLNNGDEVILKQIEYKVVNDKDNSNYGFYVYILMQKFTD